MLRIMLLMLVASPCMADIWQMYDGDGNTPQGLFPAQAGVTCAHFNAAGNLAWRNPGGDWIDGAGVPQGNTPVSSAPFVRNLLSPQVVEVDAMRLLSADGIVVRKVASSSVTVASRESSMPPVLSLTLLDGTVINKRPTADASLLFLYTGQCQYNASGKSLGLFLGNNAAVMTFGPLPSNVVRAKLRLTLLSSYAPGSINTFAMTIPRLPPTAAAAAAAGSVAVSSDPGVYYYEPWETDDWWTRNGGSQRPNSQWTQDLGRFHVSAAGLWFADGSTTLVPAQGTNGTVMVNRGSGFRGRGLMIAYHPTALAAGVNVSSVEIPNVIDDRRGREADEAWLTYRIKYGSNFYGFVGCEGGKTPGMSSPTTACGNSGVPANGLCGWSLRLSYKLICDPSNPAFQHIRLYMYAYHGLLKGWYGDAWYGNGEALLELGRWYCVEEHVKVNTPGVADGVAQFYVDGKLAMDRQGVYLRAVKPPQGYGFWNPITPTKPAPDGATIVTDNFGRSFWFTGRAVETDLGISRAWMVVHNGGARAPGKTAQMWLDEIKVSHRRVGCN